MVTEGRESKGAQMLGVGVYGGGHLQKLRSTVFIFLKGIGRKSLAD